MLRFILPVQMMTGLKDETPKSSAQPSPTLNLSREFALAVQTESYNEIWSKIQMQDDQPAQLLLTQVLHPSRESVEEALGRATSTPLTFLISDYFKQSEDACRLCLLLCHHIRHARSLYAPLNDLIDILPVEIHGLTEAQCNWAYKAFLEFDLAENPFPCPDSLSFQDLRSCFYQLKQQLEDHIHKSRSKVSFFRRFSAGSALCLIGATCVIIIAAIVIATHALIVLATCPIFLTCLPQYLLKRELSNLSQLDAAAKGTYVLNNDLDTIDRLVTRLHSAVEGDKILIRIGLERGPDRHPIFEVVKQLRRNYPNFGHQLKDLEEHICLCFATINRARSLLLQQVRLHQPFDS
uniref:Uncharacterized protein n=1 Tax=Kalanchoe fedtschenkoi TaxID=63787 RepID=A0A7N0UQF4_KALFE